MSQTCSETCSATNDSARKYNPTRSRSSELIAQFLFKIANLSLIVVLVGLLSSFLGNVANAANRTTILNYICSTYESARLVALERSWENPESIPPDCRTMFQQPFELRAAEVLQIIEVIPVKDGRWIEIGSVRLGSIESGFSAGIAEQLFLY